MSVIQSVKEIAASPANSAVYEVTFDDGTISVVPHDPANRDYAAVQAWIAAGGTLQTTE